MMCTRGTAVILLVFLSTTGFGSCREGIGNASHRFAEAASLKLSSDGSNTEGGDHTGETAPQAQNAGARSSGPFSMGLPLGPTLRSGLDYGGRNLGSFIMQLQIDYPYIVEAAQGILSWAKGRLPETPDEAQAFLDAVTSARVFVDNAAKWIFDTVPSDVRDRVYGSFFQTVGQQLPREFYEAASAANPAVTQYFKSSAAGGTAEGPQQKAVSPWPELRAAIARKHGPITNMPNFVQLSDRCPIGDDKTVDIDKATQDVVHRVMQLLVDRLSSEDKTAKNAPSELAAFCAAAGVFVASWQQHQQNLLEDANGPKAHGQLTTKLKNAYKYILPSYSSTGETDTAEFNRRKKEMKDLSKSNAMKHCVAYIVAAGRVATQSFKGGTANYPARSLYGGLANTIRTKFSNVQDAVVSFHALATSYKKSRDAQALGALCVALLVSSRLKNCFVNAAHLSTLSIYHMHVDGAALLKRVAAVDSTFAPDETSKFLCDVQAREADMDAIFRRLMKVATSSWEQANTRESPKGENLEAGKAASGSSTPEESDSLRGEL